MRAWMTVVSMVGLFGCGGPSTPDDGGGTDGGSDTGVIELCARNADCDDGLFCTGVDRCEPGGAGADARGCVVEPAPCDTASCDEETDRCGACSAEERDRDGDSDPSEACGGNDCDDSDPLRSSMHSEVCDMFHVDEDCTESTIHGGRGMPGDVDRDGQISVSCANIIDGVEFARGDDCDDGDPAIYLGAPERCNGADDDCDTLIDEDFECVQSQVVMGDTSCGNPGSRECSATCSWVGDFAVAESAATCDYCDDSGLGLAQEVPFAGGMTSAVADSGWVAEGTARRIFVLPETWAVNDTASGLGAVRPTTTFTVGYGRVWISASVETRATGSGLSSGLWSLRIFPGSSTLAATAGWQAVWRFSTPIVLGPVVEPDSACFLTLGSTPRAIVSCVPGYTIPTASAQDGPMGSSVGQLLRVQIVPDDPATAPDETTLELWVGFSFVGGCANDSVTPCGMRVSPGDVLNAGITASAGPSNGIDVTMPSITVDRYSTCR